MNVQKLMSDLQEVVQQAKRQPPPTELKTAAGYTVPRVGNLLNPETNDFVANVLTDVRTLASVPKRLPAVAVKWEQCRAEKGKRRELKAEARRAYYQQYEARRACKAGVQENPKASC